MLLKEGSRGGREDSRAAVPAGLVSQAGERKLGGTGKGPCQKQEAEEGPASMQTGAGSRCASPP